MIYIHREKCKKEWTDTSTFCNEGNRSSLFLTPLERWPYQHIELELCTLVQATLPQKGGNLHAKPQNGLRLFRENRSWKLCNFSAFFFSAFFIILNLHHSQLVKELIEQRINYIYRKNIKIPCNHRTVRTIFRALFLTIISAMWATTF